MTIAPDSTVVRQIVQRIFEELSGQPGDELALDEMILIQEGHYRGRSYRAGSLMAMWLVGIGILQVYGAEGEMLRTVNLFEEQNSLRRAA